MLTRKTRGALAAAILLAGSAGLAQAEGLLFSEGFEDFGALGAAGWVFTNASASPGQPWFAGNTGIFEAAAGSAGSYAAANFLSTTLLEGAISNWMITPELSVTGGEFLSFSVRTETGSTFADRIELHLSVGGSTELAAFTPLGSTGVAPDSWTSYTFQLPLFAEATTVRIGFEYAVTNALDANYVGIDSVALAPIPEPATAVLLGLGVAGLLIRRRLVA
jgi:hypothetical protein